MAVDLDDLEAERLKLLVEGLDARDVRNGAVDLQTVLVYDDNEVVKLVVRSEHRRLPNLTFLHLSVAEDCIGTIVFVVKLRRKRHTARCGNTLSERTCAHVDTGGFFHIGVTLQHCADVTQHGQLLPREVALERENRVKAGAAVTL